MAVNEIRDDTANNTSGQVKESLSKYAASVYSQWGEDGIVDKIFSIIDVQSKVCVEFGAWDGFHFSNTANLWANKGWTGILIEGHRKRFFELKDNTKDYDCICINTYVGVDSENSLEGILANNEVSSSIDLLSIDIDGNDYYIFDSLKFLRPRVVVCEYNPTIPAHVDVYQKYGDRNFGCSAASLLRLANEKGYTLVEITDTNCFFVLDQYKDLFAAYETRLGKIRNDKYLTYLMTSYSGDYIMSDGALPYGCNSPYRGSLVGNVRTLRPMMRSLRAVRSIFRKLRAILFPVST